MTAATVDWSRVPAHIVRDIDEFVRDNPGQISREHMSPQEALRCYMEWNGLIGWSSTILEAVESLGAPRKGIRA